MLHFARERRIIWRAAACGTRSKAVTYLLDGRTQIKAGDLQGLSCMPEKHFVWDRLGAAPPQLPRLGVASAADCCKEPSIRTDATDAEVYIRVADISASATTRGCGQRLVTDFLVG